MNPGPGGGMIFSIRDGGDPGLSSGFMIMKRPLSFALLVLTAVLPAFAADQAPGALEWVWRGSAAK